jgi:hypothetical protein
VIHFTIKHDFILTNTIVTITQEPRRSCVNTQIVVSANDWTRDFIKNVASFLAKTGGFMVDGSFAIFLNPKLFYQLHTLCQNLEN